MSEIVNLTLMTLTRDSRNSSGLWAAVVRRVLRGAAMGSRGTAALLGTAALVGMAYGQAPRYQSPFGTPAAQAPQPLPTPTAITPNGTVVEDVVARVNDQIISRSDVERSQQQLDQELQQSNLPAGEREQRQKDMLRDMIDQQLLISKGKELGLNADAEVVRRLDEIRKQNHLDSMEDLEKSARQQGVNFEDFKAGIRNNVITQEVVRDEVGRRLQMTQAQEQAYYEAHKQEYAQPEQIRLSEILIPLAADADAPAIAQAQKKADDVAAKVKAGEKFDDLAKKYSGGPTAAQGGELGLYKRGGPLAKVLEDQTFALNAGEVTAPIRTRQGFVLLKVTEHQPAGIPTLKEVEPQIQEAMYMGQMQPKLREYLTRLREEAFVEVAPGFVDSGASPKQTKLVFSAYAAPTPKKKKVEQKARFDRSARSVAATASTKTAAGVPALPAEGVTTATSATPDASTGVSRPPEGEALTASGATPAPSGGTAAAGATAAGTTASTSPEAVATTAGKSRASRRTVASVPKRKKIRREKIRFGQAPRNSLPAGSLETATGTDVGEGATSAAVTPGGMMADGAPGAAAGGQTAAPGGSTTEVSSVADADPLAPKTVSTGKTRFSSREKEVKAEKVAAKDAKAREKIAATPVGPDRQEVATRKTQSAPLGLNGDTATKKKKTKVKGAPKERLQDKKPDETAATPIAPTVNPTLGTSVPGTTPADAATSDRTTLPPVTAPAPGAPPQGQPLSPTGNPPTTPNGTTAPPQ